MNNIYEFNSQHARDFASLIRAETRVKGDELQLKTCPYCKGGEHHDKWTFAINLKNGVFNCLRGKCNASGNMITLHKDYGFSLGRDVDAYYDKCKYRRFKRPDGGFTPRPSSIKYLANRGISERITRLYEITAQNENENIIVFPFYDENNSLWFFKYRNADYKKGSGRNKEWCEANRKPILFGMNHCNFENKTLVLTEGQIDSLSVAEAGVENAVSVPTGKNGFTWIPYCWSFLGRFEELVIFGDYENGEVSLLDGMKTRFHGRIKVVRAEDYHGCKDANEILQKFGKEAVKQAVENAEPLPVKHVKNMADVQRVNPDELEHIETGLECLDSALGGLYYGQLIILTGKRGLGKSTVASQLATFALKQQQNIFYYSGELADWNVRMWLDFQIAGDRYILSRDGKYGKEYRVMENSRELMAKWYDRHIWLYDNDAYIDDEGVEDKNSIIDTLVETINQYGVRFAVIDNLMTAIDLDGSDLNQQQTKFVQRLKEVAKRYNIIVLLVVHPRKESSNTKFFSNDDIAGSSNITNLADAIIKYDRAKRRVITTNSKGEEVEKLEEDPDSDERVLTIHKNRMWGRTDNEGTRLYYQESSKRISAVENDFDWELGWENESDFTAVEDLDDLPFKVDYEEIPY